MTQAQQPTKTKNKKPSVAEYLAAQFDLCGKTQLEIARECGFDKPNVLTMFKQGKSKLPLARVGKMAQALGVDPLYLFSLVMSEYEPETWQAIEGLVLKHPYVSQNEYEIVELLRETGVPNPKVHGEGDKERLLSVFQTLKPENAIAVD